MLLTLPCLTLKNDQTYFKNHAVWTHRATHNSLCKFMRWRLSNALERKIKIIRCIIFNYLKTKTYWIKFSLCRCTKINSFIPSSFFKTSSQERQTLHSLILMSCFAKKQRIIYSVKKYKISIYEFQGISIYGQTGTYESLNQHC